MYTLLYLKWITKTYCVAHETLLNVRCQHGWEEVWGRIDTFACMAESLSAHLKLQHC